jgi:hypothetical protein
VILLHKGNWENFVNSLWKVLKMQEKLKGRCDLW